MEVACLQNLAEAFKDVEKSFAVIGGCACSQWFAESGLRFRNTRDVDMVLLLEGAGDAFFGRFWEFIRKGGYNDGQFVKGRGLLYHFEREDETPLYPKQIELLTTDDITKIPDGIRIIEVKASDPVQDLSAVLLDPEYHALVRANVTTSDLGLPLVKPSALLPLKAKAYLNLLEDKKAGRVVKDKDILKHRNDVFSLIYLLNPNERLDLVATIKEDISRFVALLRESHEDWEGILSHLKGFGRTPLRKIPEYLDLIVVHYGLARE